MSIETISNAVCESSRRASTAFEIRSGFSSTSIVRVGRADGADDAFAHPGDDRLFGGSADQLIQIGPHRHAGFDLELDAVFGHGVERFAAGAARRAIDHLGIDARLHGFEHVAAGQVDGRRQFKVEVDRLGLLRGDDRPNHQRHIAACQVMSFQAPCW